MLEVRNLYKTFHLDDNPLNDRRALNGVDLTIDDGDFITVADHARRLELDAAADANLALHYERLSAGSAFGKSALDKNHIKTLFHFLSSSKINRTLLTSARGKLRWTPRLTSTIM